MSTPTGLFRGSRALFAAAKNTAAFSTRATAAVTEVTLTQGSASKSKVQKKSKDSDSDSDSDSDIDLTQTKILPVSPALQSFVGCPEISLGEACNKLWAHIDAHNLEKNDHIILDDTLKKVFDGRDELKPEDMAERMCAHFVMK